MLTLVESISLAGDRAKQNDDACGYAHDTAWVIDGATDLHGEPFGPEASDAAWLAHVLDTALHNWASPNSGGEASLRGRVREIVDGLIAPWWAQEIAPGRALGRWMLPTASLLMAADHAGTLQGLDLGDCRCYALDAKGEVFKAGGHDSDEEERAAADAVKRVGGGSLLRDAQTLDLLRAKRAEHNLSGGAYWVVGLQPECIDHARAWTLQLARPAHVLLCTDGFSALVDKYRVYDAASLVRATLDKGLQELGRELREIETADAGGAKHPRFKPSDDATAMLLRLT